MLAEQTDVIFRVEWAHRGEEWPRRQMFRIKCDIGAISVNFS